MRRSLAALPYLENEWRCSDQCRQRGLHAVAEAGSPVSVTLIQPTAVDTPFPEHARNYMDPRAEASDASHRADPGGAGDPGCGDRTEARR